MVLHLHHEYNVQILIYHHTQLLDEEVLWLNEYTQSRIDKAPGSVWSFPLVVGQFNSFLANNVLPASDICVWSSKSLDNSKLLMQ